MENNVIIEKPVNEIVENKTKVIDNELATNYVDSGLICNGLPLQSIEQIKLAIRLHFSLAINKKYNAVLRNADGEPIKAQIKKYFGDNFNTLKVSIPEPLTKGGLIVESKVQFYERIKNEASVMYRNALRGVVEDSAVEFD
jgi:hypothetical protein